MITTPHWIASSSPGLFSTLANWMLFLQLVRALSLQLYVVFLQCRGSSMLSTPIVLESLDSPLLQETAKFAIHALYTKFVGRSRFSLNHGPTFLWLCSLPFALLVVPYTHSALAWRSNDVPVPQSCL